jgi:hypothetical protein
VVHAARLIFDKPDSAPVAMQASDGAFNEGTEALRASFKIPAGTTSGAHPVWIQAFDGTTWGATAVTVLYIDARPPTVSGLAASDAVRAAGQPVVVSFNAVDDRSGPLAYGIEFRSQATNALVARLTKLNVAAGGQSISWTPALTDPPGPYLVKLAVADASNNATIANVGTVVS